jgi:hypothetical protein
LKQHHFLLKLLTKINHFNPISRSGSESWYRLDLINLRKTHRRLSISNANKIQRWELKILETLKKLEAILDRTRIWVGIKRQDRIFFFYFLPMKCRSKFGPLAGFWVLIWARLILQYMTLPLHCEGHEPRRLSSVSPL